MTDDLRVGTTPPVMLMEEDEQVEQITDARSPTGDSLLSGRAEDIQGRSPDPMDRDPLGLESLGGHPKFDHVNTGEEDSFREEVLSVDTGTEYSLSTVTEMTALERLEDLGPRLPEEEEEVIDPATVFFPGDLKAFSCIAVLTRTVRDTIYDAYEDMKPVMGVPKLDEAWKKLYCSYFFNYALKVPAENTKARTKFEAENPGLVLELSLIEKHKVHWLEAIPIVKALNHIYAIIEEFELPEDVSALLTSRREGTVRCLIDALQLKGDHMMKIIQARRDNYFECFELLKPHLEFARDINNYDKVETRTRLFSDTFLKKFQLRLQEMGKANKELTGALQASTQMLAAATPEKKNPGQPSQKRLKSAVSLSPPQTSGPPSQATAGASNRGRSYSRGPGGGGHSYGNYHTGGSSYQHQDYHARGKVRSRGNGHSQGWDHQSRGRPAQSGPDRRFDQQRTNFQRLREGSQYTKAGSNSESKKAALKDFHRHWDKVNRR